MSWAYRQRAMIRAADPFFSSVSLLALNESGADTSTTFDDQSNNNLTITAGGNFQWDTAQAPTGLTSSGLSDGTTDSLRATTNAVFGFGTGDATVEFFARYNVNTGTQVLADLRGTGGEVVGPLFYSNGTNIRYHANSGDRITGSIPSAGVWFHLAWARVSGVSKLFIDGTQVGSDFTDTINFTSSLPCTIAEATAGGSSFNGWIAAFRVTKGVGRYTSNFTTPTLPFLP